MWMGLCFVDRRDQVDIDEMKDFLYLSLIIKQTCYRATFLPSLFFIHSFIHSLIQFILFIHSFIHSSAWLAHEYMDVLLLCWFQKERDIGTKGTHRRRSEEYPFILNDDDDDDTQRQLMWVKKEEEEGSEKESWERKKRRKKKRERDRVTAISINRI